MNNLKTKYRFVAALLLAVILSHITLFHFELEEKILCVGEGDHFHIENIEDSHSAINPFLKLGLAKSLESSGCTDYKLDNHIDENIVKSNFNTKIKFNVSTQFDFSQIKNDNKNSLTKNYNIQKNNRALESLTTVTLLI